MRVSKISLTFFSIFIVCWSFVHTASVQRLASDFMLSRVDYCNAVLAVLPTSALAPLQRVLNAAARFVASATWPAHVQTVCAYARRSQRNQFFLCNGYNNTDLVIARTSPASFSNDDWIRHPPHKDTMWIQSFLWCWTAREECSCRRYKKHYRLVILKTSHQDTLFYWHIWIKQFSRLYYVRRFWTILGGVICAL